MDNQPATNPSRNSLARFWPWLMVLVVLLFVGYIRIRLLEMPLERDEGEYAYAGQLILQGIPPYELAYNMKLPGTYFAYALGMAVFGETIAGIHLTLIIANSLTIIFIFLLGRKLSGVTAGLVACASYGIMSVSAVVLGMEAHANHFVVLFAVPATWLLLKAGEPNRRGILFASGLLYGLAFLMKQQGICFGIFGWIFLFWQAARNKSTWSGVFAKKGMVFGTGMILPLGLTCLFLALAGDFSKFWFWTFTYAHAYVTSMPWLDGIKILGMDLKNTLDLFLGFWITLAVGLPCAGLDKNIRQQWFFVAAFSFCSLLGTAAGLYFRPHYFILMLPAFAILQGIAVVSLQRALRFGVVENVFKSLPVIWFATVLAWVVFYQARFFFQLSPNQACENLHQTPFNRNPFVESPAVARYIREHSTENARIAVIGSEPQIYFYAQRHSATGYIYTYALMESQPNALKMQREMMREIESVRPEYLVYAAYEYSWSFQPHSDRTILRWFDQYANRFYEQIGLVQMDSTGKIEYLWDDASKNHPKPKGEYMAVYKLKTISVEAN
jgi:hypothetical protein